MKSRARLRLAVVVLIMFGLFTYTVCVYITAVFLIFSDPLTGRVDMDITIDTDRGDTSPEKVRALQSAGLIQHKVVLSVEERQRVRQRVLIRSCSSLDFDRSPEKEENLKSEQLASFQHTITIDNLKLLYCYIPKVSCTSWKRLFLVSIGYFESVDAIKHPHIQAEGAFPKLDHLPVDEANLRLKQHAHFLFVRNPFSRLLSAYREKIESKDLAKSNYFCKFMTRWFEETDPEYLTSRNASSSYTFSEFVRYVIARRDDNEHWTDQHQLCPPCSVKYDFIGKYETLQEDAEYILRTFANDSSLTFPAPQKRPTHSSDDDIMLRYYRRIPDRDLEALAESLYTDLRLFGYSIPDSVKRVGMHLSENLMQLIDIG